MYFGYGILANESLEPNELTALNGSGIDAVFIEEGSLGMLCGSTEKAEPTVMGVRHYNQSLCELVKSKTLIPLRFGTVFETEAEIRKVLRQNHSKYLKLLKTFEGTFEVELKISWEQSLFQSTMLTHKKLARWKKALEKGSGKGYDVVEFGQAVQETADEERRRIARFVLSNLNSFAKDFIQKDCTDEYQAFYGIFLIHRDQEEIFDQTLDSISDQLGSGFSYKYTGPWPVHHFVNK